VTSDNPIILEPKRRQAAAVMYSDGSPDVKPKHGVPRIAIVLPFLSKAMISGAAAHVKLL
jgi:hypothetical protein